MSGFGSQSFASLRHPYPGDPILLAATPQRAPPEVDDMVPEYVQCPRIGRHCVVVEVAADDVPQPLSLFSPHPISGNGCDLELLCIATYI
jgi:hypothetical protein